MDYISTRNKKERVSSARAILQGISKEGGLFVPESIPVISKQELELLTKQDYIQRACMVLGKFLTDYTHEELENCIRGAYEGEKFADDQVAPLSKLGENTYILELWHGPTLAFKDMALQLLPRLLTTASAKLGNQKEIIILVATSGDTGKAALEGFKNVEGTRIMVFYPSDGVSAMQKLQMITQEGKNVSVVGIRGNFDDAQSSVKKVFTDEEIAKYLSRHDMMFSSANSINWGRLVPQIVYYVNSYCQLVADEEITMGDQINIVVPTGNFGNILAAYYAKHMGVPIHKLICASNQNNVLTDFIRTGTYNKNRSFYTTISPSMDILISSNLERLLFLLNGQDDQVVSDLMSELSENGSYRLSKEALDKLQAEFFGGCCDDLQTKGVISGIYQRYSYLCDTHTAVALGVYDQYCKETGDHTKTIVASTANPYKFPRSVLSAIGADHLPEDEFEVSELLNQKTGCPVPAQITELQTKEVRFHRVCDTAGIADVVREALK